jgi:hypothetical protein
MAQKYKQLHPQTNKNTINLLTPVLGTKTTFKDEKNASPKGKENDANPEICRKRR